MTMSRDEADRIATQFLGCPPGSHLGTGIDGTVYFTHRETAIKVHKDRSPLRRHPDGFVQELLAYQRLAKHQVQSIGGLSVPRLVGHSTELRVIEMTIVKPPYLLDFAKSSLDEPPNFGLMSEQDWLEKIQDEFEDRADRVLGIYHELRRRFGIYHLDLSPRNVNFGDGPKGA